MTKQNTKTQKVIKSLRQAQSNLQEWAKSRRYPKRFGSGNFEGAVNVVRSEILHATSDLPRDVRRLRLQGRSDAASVIQEAYDALLGTVDARKLQKENPQLLVAFYFEVDGEGGPKERAQGLTDTIEDVVNSLQGKKESTWNPPRGYIGSNAIESDYGVPRQTLQGWQKKDDVQGGVLEGEIKKDPTTREQYFPRKWLDARLKTYKPRKPKA